MAISLSRYYRICLKICLRIDGVGMAINYGLDRVRFPAPLPADRRVRARLALERLESIAGGVQAHWAATVELENMRQAGLRRADAGPLLLSLHHRLIR